jgi:hypothetical protein
MGRFCQALESDRGVFTPALLVGGTKRSANHRVKACRLTVEFANPMKTLWVGCGIVSLTDLVLKGLLPRL